MPAMLSRRNAMEEQVGLRSSAPDLVKAPFLQFGDRWLNMESKAFGQNEAISVFGLGGSSRPTSTPGLHHAVLRSRDRVRVLPRRRARRAIYRSPTTAYCASAAS